ncbi:MAG TPA: hypothetical protein VGM06_20490 [Polyangiaceae bacterium]
MKPQGALLLVLFGAALILAAPLIGCGEDSFLPDVSPGVASRDASDDGDATASSDSSVSANMHPDGAGTVSDAGVVDASDARAEGSADGGGARDGLAPEGSTCDPTQSPHDDPCVLTERLGVFVSSAGSDANPGTRAAPLQSISAGLVRAAQLGVDRVYVCQGSYSEIVRVASLLSVYGGLACTDQDAGWHYGDGGPSQLTGPSNAIALTVDGVAGPLAIEDLRVVAADALGQDDAGNGESSIAVLVNVSSVNIRRCVFIAGSGQPGSDGTTGNNYTGVTAPRGAATDGGTGAPGGSIVCVDGTSSTGGQGGDAGLAGGGGVAVPMPSFAVPFDGAGGTSPPFSCSLGRPGANGDRVEVAIPPPSFGAWVYGQWSPSMGVAGANGRPGQGGGGGGGLSDATQGGLGLGGTGGGAGGCGGGGGSAATGGGASVALASITSSLSLVDTALVTSDAGPGGAGGSGQAGQDGGPPGISTVLGNCAGGLGGNGAGGGGGGGGAGGISVCMLYRGFPPLGTAACTLGSAGPPGAGGAGGVGGSIDLDTAPSGMDGRSGLPGLSSAELEIP